MSELENERNMGTGYSRNKGIASSQGKYIAFLDADDYWLPNKLETQINFLKNNKKVAIVYSDYFLEQNISNVKNLKLIKMPSKVTNKINKFINHIPNSTAVLNAELAKKFRYPFIKVRNDYIFWNTILNNTELKAFNCNPGTGYVVYGSNPGISSNKIRLLSYQWQTYRKYFKYNLIESAFGIIINILRKIV